jgi:hypothetical protein
LKRPPFFFRLQLRLSQADGSPPKLDEIRDVASGQYRSAVVTIQDGNYYYAHVRNLTVNLTESGYLVFEMTIDNANLTSIAITVSCNLFFAFLNCYTWVDETKNFIVWAIHAINIMCRRKVRFSFSAHWPALLVALMSDIKCISKKHEQFCTSHRLNLWVALLRHLEKYD